VRPGILFNSLKLIGLASSLYLYNQPQPSEALAQQQAAPELGQGGVRPQGVGKSPAREIVFVVDTTKSMSEALNSVKEAVSEFLATATITAKERVDAGGSLRTGLLFYRDRKIGTECQLDYVVQWQVLLTENAGFETVSQTLAKLNAAKATTCGSDEEEEAVFDALQRAILDPNWQDSSNRLLVLIGDAGPHPPDDARKNPMRFDRAAILELADRCEVRILAVQIKHDPYQDVSAFELLATGRREDLKGRFVAVPAIPKAIREALNRALWAEWNEKAHIKTGATAKCRLK
jgi:hypothetical protein